jgi:endonuclease G, mitochondrial
MIRTLDDLADAIAIAEQNNDLAALKELEKYFRPKEDPAPQPFMPAVALNEAAFGQPPSLQESEAAIPFANGLSRAQRLVQYRQKRASGYEGPILVCEGDSWFEYPFFLQDIIDYLMKEYAVLSLAGAGHHLVEMVANDEYTEAIAQEKPDFFLISGGGNDMLHDGRLRDFLLTYQDGMQPADLLDRPALNGFLQTITGNYRTLLANVTQRFPRLTILAHGYDYVLPRDKGTWLGGPLTQRQVPPELWNDALELLIDEFNEALKTLEALFPNRFYHIDCRGRVGSQKNKWHDELHPKNAGYGRAAARFAERIRSLQPVSPMTEGLARAATITPAAVPVAIPMPVPSRRSLGSLVGRRGTLSTPEVAASLMQGSMPVEQVPLQRLAEPVTRRQPQPMARRVIAFDETVELAEAIIDDGQVIAAPTAPTATEHPCASLEQWRALLTEEDHIAFQHYEELIRELNQPEAEAELETRRELTSGFDIFSIERIIGDSNIFQVNYLARGERAARTVGRISIVNKHDIPMGFGTGFLVAPGLLLTNNHVISDATQASHSYILLEYEYDADNGLKQTERFDFTGDIFLTSEELDFTFISVGPVSRSGRKLADYGHLRLIRESGKALKREFVSILQHANGLPKQIAMRDSMILGRKDQYIYYSTDTNSGSSGSPVVNDEWFPVALHHRTVPDFNKPCNFVANRGIRISSIFERLDQAASSNGMAQRILRLLEPNEAPTTISSQLPAGTFDADQLDGAGTNGDGTNGDGSIERLVEPYHESAYENRQGYDENFLGISVPLPKIRNLRLVSKRLDIRDHVIPYEHFSLVMFKPRRIALFTASNVDASHAKQEPEPGRDYSRDALGGLRPNDREKWFEDPRVSSQEQLPNRFFDQDGGAFDKGHIVRRNDVTWGDTYEQVQRANGDTFHLTNCSPQVAGFNQSMRDGLWGELENIVFEQAEAEQYTIFAGPVLDPTDQSFRGKDNRGEVLVQIPAKYWKVIVARKGNELQSFAFLLEQDLSTVPLEFQVDAAWQQRMISIPALEVLVRHFRFPQIIHDTDQAQAEHGEALRTAHALELLA